MLHWKPASYFPFISPRFRHGPSFRRNTFAGFGMDLWDAEAFKNGKRAENCLRVDRMDAQTVDKTFLKNIRFTIQMTCLTPKFLNSFTLKHRNFGVCLWIVNLYFSRKPLKRTCCGTYTIKLSFSRALPNIIMKTRIPKSPQSLPWFGENLIRAGFCSYDTEGEASLQWSVPGEFIFC